MSAQFIHNLKQENDLLKEGADAKRLKELFYASINAVLPPVWISYDPNWRSLSRVCAIATAEFAALLPEELMARMDEAMKRAVQGSVDRRRSDVIPMNTNIELMHILSHILRTSLSADGLD